MAGRWVPMTQQQRDDVLFAGAFINSANCDPRIVKSVKDVVRAYDAAVEVVVVPRKALEIARQELQWAYNDLRNNHDSAIREGDALKAIDAALDSGAAE